LNLFWSERLEQEVNESIEKKIVNLKAKAASLTILLIIILFFAALSGIQFIGEVSAIDYDEYTGTLGGGDYALRIPDLWNGMLIIYCRGWSPILPPASDNLAYFNATVSEVVNQGYAIAGSNYGVAGFCIQAGVNSSYELTNFVVSTYNVTGKVFLLGYSMGGAVALLLLEKYPDLYSGVLDVYGVKDLKEEYNVTMFSSSIEVETGGTPTTQPEAYEDRSPTYHANITRPVITVHGTNDTAVPFYQATMYQTAVASAGRSNLYRLVSVADEGHLSPVIEAQVPSLFADLVVWSNYLTGAYDWPMFRHDLTHSGYSEAPAPNTNQTLWAYTANGGFAGSPAVVDDRVYAGSWDGIFYCLDAATGTQIWNYTTGNWANSSPAVVDGKVYAGSGDFNVYCWDATTGDLIWNYTTGDEVISSPAVTDGKVYVGSFDDNVYCLDATTGALIWNYTTGYDIYASSPAIADGKVYIGSEDTNFYCLDATTGALVWNYTMGTDCGMPAVANGKVYQAGGTSNNFYCLNATSGDLIWNYTVGSNANNVAIAYGNMYGNSHDNNIYCLDAANGTQIWNYTTGADVISPPSVADGMVYAGSFDGNVYCLNATTGDFIWSYETGSTVFYSSPAIANGVVYVPSGDGNVYAFGSEYVVPEGFGVEAVLLLSTVAIVVCFGFFRKLPRKKKWQ
jgi:outer membrane protein assembly factor BamB/pimeloyl-ACP methyl ester carboxylesterase